MTADRFVDDRKMAEEREKKMKWKSLKRALLLAMLIVVLPKAGFAGEGAADYAALIAQCEPGPYGGASMQETNPFQPASVSPWEVMEQIDRQRNARETKDYLHSLGLPLEDNDCEYIFQYRDRSAVYRFLLVSGSGRADEAIAVSYAYSEEENDNIVLLFAGQDGAYTLTDCLFSFGRIRLVTDAAHENAWLVGDTGSAYQSTRWYSLPGRKIVLKYLAEGTQTDRMDFHVSVKSQGEFIQDGMLPEDGLYAVFKQVGVIDFTRTESDAQATETVLYTQLNAYRAQPDGTFDLILSKNFEGLELQEAAQRAWRQLMDTEAQ